MPGKVEKLKTFVSLFMIAGAAMTIQKRPLGLGALNSSKKTKEEGNEQVSAVSPANETEQINDEDQLVLRLPEGETDLEDLQVIFNNALENLNESEIELATKWFRACVHECDRIGNQAESSTQLPPYFYQIFGDSLYHLGTLEADMNGGYTAELRKESKDFLEASIERYELGLENFKDVNLLLALGKAKLRLQAVIHCWYMKKESYDPEMELENALNVYSDAFDLVDEEITEESDTENEEEQAEIDKERADKYADLIQLKTILAWTLHDFALFINEIELATEYYAKSSQIFNQIVRDILDFNSFQNSDDLVYEALCGMGCCYLATGLMYLDECGDQDSLVDFLQKGRSLFNQPGEQVMKKASEIAEASSIAERLEFLKTVKRSFNFQKAEIEMNLGNYIEDLREEYYQMAVQDYEKCLQIEEGSLPDHILKFIDDIKNGVDESSEE